MSRVGERLDFDYNADGLRVKKVHTRGDTAVTTEYTLHGKNIVHLKQGAEELHFFYDAQNRPAIVRWNGEDYGFLQNLQGDVIGLLDSYGAVVVLYSYDAWGRPLSKTGEKAAALGTLNPFRYRGYVWDEETEMYYLESRYYSSFNYRMLNCDRIGAALFDDRELANRNAFNYCDNNPVLRSDSKGEFWNIVIGAVIGAAIGAAASVVTQLITTGTVDGSQVAVATVGGAISGGFAATGIPVSGQIAVNGVIGATSNIANYCIDTSPEEFKTEEMLLKGFEGLFVGLVAGYVGGNGTGSKHLSSSWRAFAKSLSRGKPLPKAAKYFYSQIRKEAVRCGSAAIPAIMKSSIPGIADGIIMGK